jgi:hypothetical protein
MSIHSIKKLCTFPPTTTRRNGTPIHCRYTADTLPIHCRYTADTLPIHCRYTADTRYPIPNTQYPIPYRYVPQDPVSFRPWHQYITYRCNITYNLSRRNGTCVSVFKKTPPGRFDRGTNRSPVHTFIVYIRLLYMQYSNDETRSEPGDERVPGISGRLSLVVPVPPLQAGFFAF